MAQHPVVMHEEWIAARKVLLAREKELTRARDAVVEARRALPWEEVSKPYVFETARGRETLADLFDGRSQLVVYHFMFDPSWNAGCPQCSRWADGFSGAIVHLNNRDVTMVAISRAPLTKLLAYQKRMGWTFTWASAADTDFNTDFQASFTPDEVKNKKAYYNFIEQDPRNSEREGLSVFVKDDRGRTFHTYSTYARGIEQFSVDYALLDLVPKGRDEAGRGPFWVRRHDEYAART
jgi:predicted dithiol-disulfide oxidoreductase (DUF899 family)